MSSLKSWQVPWSTEDIIKNASNWSLAGDAGLLKHLESFSENMLTKAEETQNNLNKLLSGLNNASLALEEAKNDFRTLRNTQFIESRVYEDDETVQEENKAQEDEDKKQSEEEKMRDVKEAILAGIAVVEKHFDKVEVSASDSEDEGDFTSFVLKPKDPYIDRPLPFIIGTDEWHKKWHVGLLDSSSESEADKVSEKFSESDSESDLSYDGDKINEISNTFLNTNRTNVNQPVANSTFDESSKPPDLFGDSDTENNDQTLNYVAPQNKNFANELTSKLGKYVDETEVNRKPINKSVTSKQYGNLFSDEPPPIDEFNENNNVEGLFSGGGGLFDDTDNAVNLWNEDTRKIDKPIVHNLFDEDDALFYDTLSYRNNTSKDKDRPVLEIERGLFDDEDDDLFNDNITRNISSNPTPYLPSTNKAIPFLAEEPPELESSPSNSESKKPFGGVKLIGKSDLFDSKVKISPKNSFESSDEDKGKRDSADKVSVIKTETEKKQKQISLFDDDEDDESALFENDLFSNFSSKSIFDTGVTISKEKAVESKEDTSIVTIVSTVDSESTKEVLHSDNKFKSTSLFDDNEDLFSTSIIKSERLEDDVRPQTPEEDIPPISSVYDSIPPDISDWDTQSDNLFDDGGLFNNIPEMSSQRSGLFDNEPPSLFFDSSGIVKDFSTRLGTDDSFSPYASSTRRYSTDIFNEEQSNDSFFVTKNKSQFEHQHVQSSLEIIPEVSFSNTCDNSQSNLEITPSGDIDNLYSDTTVSAVMDTLESKNDHDKLKPAQIQSAETKQVEQIEEVKEPNPISPKHDSPGKLKHNLIINVDALMPGASPPKRRQVKSSTPEEPEIQNSFQGLLLEPEESFKEAVKEIPHSNAEVLPSMTKDRVRIPVKRRPSTRKARQESLRNSVPDFKILANNDQSEAVDYQSEAVDHKPKFVSSQKGAELEKGLFTDDFEIDSSAFVDSPPEKTDDCVSIAKKVTSVVEMSTQDSVESKRPHINSDSFESEDYKQLNLFDENEEFDDIFSSKKLPPKSTILKESLFDDDLDDDDDIFGSSASTFKKEVFQSKGTTKSLEKKVIKTNQIKKLENSEAIEDPLSSFLDN